VEGFNSGVKALILMWSIKNVSSREKIMRGVNKYSQTAVFIISKHLQYMNTMKFHILAQLDIQDFCKSVKMYQCTVEKSSKIPHK
jgi:uncharacterized protein YjaZ